MRTYILLIPILLAVPATAVAQDGSRRGTPVPARALREAAEARRAVVRHPAQLRAARVAVDAVSPPPAKRPRGS